MAPVTSMSEDTLRQLEMVNSMERQQDSNLWVSTGMFAAANGVFLVALFAAFDKLAKPADLEVGFGLLGLVVNLSWVITAVRADTYCIKWIYKAKEIQGEFKMWDKDAPPGIRSWWANVMLMATFLIVWSSSVFYGVTQQEGLSAFLPLVVMAASWTVSVYAVSAKLQYERSIKKVEV